LKQSVFPAYGQVSAATGASGLAPPIPVFTAEQRAKRQQTALRIDLFVENWLEAALVLCPDAFEGALPQLLDLSIVDRMEFRCPCRIAIRLDE